MAGTQRAARLPFAQTRLLQKVSVGMQGQEGGDPGTCIVPMHQPPLRPPCSCRVAVWAEASGRSVGREHPQGCGQGGRGQHPGAGTRAGCPHLTLERQVHRGHVPK